MAARLSAFIVWAALAASVVFWTLRLAGSSPVAPAHTVPVGDVFVPNADLTRLFGTEPAPAAEAPAPALSSRFRLIGLAAPRLVGAPGIALISVDGKPARAYRLGATIEDDLVLQSVESRAVALGSRGASPSVHLELPPLAPAATGTLAPPQQGLEDATAASLPPPVPAPVAVPPPVQVPQPPPVLIPAPVFPQPQAGIPQGQNPMRPSPVPPPANGQAPQASEGPAPVQVPGAPPATGQ